MRGGGEFLGKPFLNCDNFMPHGAEQSVMGGAQDDQRGTLQKSIEGIELMVV